MFTIGHFTGEGEKPATECAPVQASKQFLRGLFAPDRSLEALVEMQKVSVSNDTGAAASKLGVKSNNPISRVKCRRGFSRTRRL
jgi:hypothetical protein